jgi:hypothetical protein
MRRRVARVQERRLNYEGHEDHEGKKPDVGHQKNTVFPKRTAKPLLPFPRRWLERQSTPAAAHSPFDLFAFFVVIS